jgi:hypothetical protein
VDWQLNADFSGCLLNDYDNIFLALVQIQQSFPIDCFFSSSLVFCALVYSVKCWNFLYVVDCDTFPMRVCFDDGDHLADERRSRAVLDFLATTDVGRLGLAPVEEDAQS